MTYRDLLYVVTVMDEGTISAAASILNISQPSLSQAITKIETQIGMDIFLRHGKHIVPTQFGTYFTEKARSVLEEWDKFNQDIDNFIATTKNTITVGVPAGLCRTLMPYVLKEIRVKYPELKIKMIEERSTMIEQLLFEGKLDLGVLHSPLRNPTIGSIKCFNSTDMLAVSKSNDFVKSHPYTDLDHLTTVSLLDLKDTPFVMMHHAKEDILIGEILDKSGFKPNVSMTTSIWYNVVDYIKNGNYAGFVDEMVVYHDSDDKDVAFYKLNVECQRTTYVAFHPTRKLSKEEFLFVDCVKRYRELIGRPE